MDFTNAQAFFVRAPDYSKKFQRYIYSFPEFHTIIFLNVYSRGGRGTKIYVYLPYRGTISFYVYIVPLGLINIFLHVERDRISCGLQATRFSQSVL